MANEPSPHSRRQSRAVGFVLAYGFMFALLGVFVGVIVGFVIIASVGISSDVKRIVGSVLLIVSLLAGITALLFIGLWLGAWRAARSPRRELRVFAPLPQGRAFQVSGTIVSAPVYQAPFSQRPCVLWHIALRHYQSISEERAGWVTVWSQSRIADVEIIYDRTRTIAVRPDAGDGGHTVTDSPGGTMTIPSGTIRMTQLPTDRHRVRIFPPTTVNLQTLDNEGLPAKLHEESAARPNLYRVAEYCLTTGDFVTGHQQPTIASEHWIPDPHAPFEMGTFSREQGSTLLLGCLAGFFIAGTLILLILGLSLAQR